MSTEFAVVTHANSGEYSLIAASTNDDSLIEIWLGCKASGATQKQYRQIWTQFRQSAAISL